MTNILRALSAATLGALLIVPVEAQPPATNVIVVTIDGLRWQEFFGGADREYFKRDAKGNAGEPERRFWRPAPADRRSTLLPFVWTTVAAKGQIFGDALGGSTSRVTNG